MLTALSIDSARPYRYWTGPYARLASCDDGSLSSESSTYAVAFDGQIHNRSDIKYALDRNDSGRFNDAQLALSCYEKWGEGFCDRIVGDYACAVWDARQRRFIMAVDPGTPRPLFYWFGQGEILFASEPRALWSEPKVPKVLDDNQMAAWLCLLPAEPQCSLFRDIWRVPPGHRVVWKNGKIQTERWWRPERLPELKLACDRDYEELLRSTLQEAVRCRLGTNDLIGSQLSGGLDSSAVTATAARLLADQGRSLTAFTAAPSHPAPEQRIRFNDEWPYAAAVAAMYPNIDHVRVANDDAPLFDALELREAVQDWPVFNPFNTIWMNGIDRAAKQRQITVLLIAQAGNITISYNGNELLASQFRSLNLAGATRTLRDLRHEGRSVLGLGLDAVDAILPNRARWALRWALGKSESSLFDYSVINSSFVHAAGAEARAKTSIGSMRNAVRGNSRHLRLAMLDRADRTYGATGTRRLFGIDTRDPTSDRRLIELCLTIPETQYLRKGVYRSLIRRTMSGLVPDQVLWEKRKGLQAADWRFGFHAAVPQLKEELVRLQHSPLAQKCLDLLRMQKLIDRWPGPNDSSSASNTDYLFALGRGIAAGRFLRRIEGATVKSDV